MAGWLFQHKKGDIKTRLMKSTAPLSSECHSNRDLDLKVPQSSSCEDFWKGTSLVVARRAPLFC